MAKKKTPKKVLSKKAKKVASKSVKKAPKKAQKKSLSKKPKSKVKPQATSLKTKTLAKNSAKSSGLIIKGMDSGMDSRIGKKAPDFSVMNDQGETVRLSDFKGKRLVVYFYPKDMTPGCTTESCDFRDSFTRLASAGVQVLGVSRDSVKSHQKFKEKYGLPFPLLADEDGKMCESFGVWVEKSMYGRKYMGIERSTFVIDEQGLFQFVYPKVSVKGHVDQVMKDMGISK